MPHKTPWSIQASMNESTSVNTTTPAAKATAGVSHPLPCAIPPRVPRSLARQGPGGAGCGNGCHTAHTPPGLLRAEDRGTRGGNCTMGNGNGSACAVIGRHVSLRTRSPVGEEFEQIGCADGAIVIEISGATSA